MLAKKAVSGRSIYRVLYKAIYYKHLGSTQAWQSCGEGAGSIEWGRGKCRKFACANCEQESRKYKCYEGFEFKVNAAGIRF